MARPNGVVSIADSIPSPVAEAAPVGGTPVDPAEGGYPPETDATGPVDPAATPPSPAPADSGQHDGDSAQELPAPGTPGFNADAATKDPPEVVEAAMAADTAEAKPVEAEVVSKALSLDVVKKTELSGNAILEMTVVQRAAYDREVSEVSEKVKGAERAYVLAQWYMGQTAIKLQRDSKEHAGSTYGQATVEGFAHDIGRDKSTVYKSMKLAKCLTFNHAQALTISVEAFQYIQKAPDKVRDWVLDEIVKRCKNGQIFAADQVERLVEAVTWYPSITAQGDKPAEVQKAIDALILWDPKPLPGKDKPEFDLGAAKKAIGGAAPELLPAVKIDEKTAIKAEKTKREQPGLNSKTGTSHVGVAKAFGKALDTIIEKAGSLVISIKEAGAEGGLSEKAFDNFAEQIEKIANDVDNAVEILQAIKIAADEVCDEEEEPAKPASKKKKAKKRGK